MNLIIILIAAWPLKLQIAQNQNRYDDSFNLITFRQSITYMDDIYIKEGDALLSQINDKPMRIGELLDKSFQLYRQHFVLFFLILLILFAPFYLLTNLLMYDLNQMTLVPSFSQDSLLDSFLGSVMDEEMLFSGVGILQFILLFVFGILFMFIIFPLGVAAVVYTVYKIKTEQLPTVGEAIKHGLKQIPRLILGTLLYLLLIAAIYIGLYIIFFILLFSGALAFGAIDALLDNNALTIFAGVIAVILVILLFLSSMILPLFFILRWAFYLPAITLEKEELGFGRSWRLTKGHIWRLVGFTLLVFLIYGIFSFVIGIGITLFLGQSLLGQLLQVLVYIVLVPLFLIPYALFFLDLRVRNDATDLEKMLAQVTDTHST